MTVIAITGVTLTGNMGGAAMLRASMDALSARFPGATFRLLSITPATDLAADHEGLEIVDARPALLILLYLPLAILAWPFIGIGAVRRLLSRLRYFRAVAEANVVVDLCGIAFVDRRGLPLLIYNLACCLPAIVLGTPIAKLAQALGPFKEPLNRRIAHFTLSRCAVVVARGEATFTHLKELAIPRIVSLPDVSFALDVPADSKDRAQELLAPLKSERPLLAVSPSEVVNRLSRAAGVDFVARFSEFLSLCIDAGWQVAVVPHSFGGEASKNNDVPICTQIVERLSSPHAALILADQDPRLLRAILGKAALFVGCRFHSVAGALAMGVPTLTVGWSHKYREMVEPLQPGNWTLDWRDFSPAEAFTRFQALAAERPAVAAALRDRLVEIRARADENFTLAAGVMRP